MKKIISLVAVACSLTMAQGAALFDMGANDTSGWTQVNNNWNTYNGADGISMVLAGGGNLFAQSQTTNVKWESGKFHGFSGTVLQEMSYRLGLSAPISQTVWGDGLKNGGQTNNTMKFNGLTSGERYCFYIVIGLGGNTYTNGVQLANTYTDAQSSLSRYTATTAGTAAGSEVGYTDMNVNSNYVCASDQVAVLKYENIIADGSGSVTFTLNGGSRSGVNAVAVARMSELVPEPSTAMLGLFGMGLFAFRRRK
ncbi:PEP-CTERM sorting domain-containing protein [Akkermansia glycaniphila]|nr:PEP-CTERM sorting domain-containing protein [Akkermansia glycaniphila]